MVCYKLESSDNNDYSLPVSPGYTIQIYVAIRSLIFIITSKSNLPSGYCTVSNCIKLYPVSSYGTYMTLNETVEDSVSGEENTYGNALIYLGGDINQPASIIIK